MFKTTEEFISVMLELLIAIRDEKNYLSVLDLYGEVKFEEALAKCVDDKLITGYTYIRKPTKPLFNGKDPRITFDGLLFIEQHQP